MITNRGVLKSVRANWASIRSSQELIERHLASVSVSAFLGGGVGASAQLRDISHAIVLLFACAVFETALQAMRRQKTFRSRSTQLGSMLEGSRGVLPWLELAAIEAAVALRNQIAHQRLTPPRADTLSAIDAIERELRHFEILPALAPPVAPATEG